MKLILVAKIRDVMHEYIINDTGIPFTNEMSGGILLLTGSGVFIERYSSWDSVLIHLSTQKAKLVYAERVEE